MRIETIFPMVLITAMTVGCAGLRENEVPDPLLGRWAADMKSFDDQPAFWLGITKDANDRHLATLLWRWGSPLLPEPVSCMDGVFRFRVLLKKAQERADWRFRWFTVKVIGEDSLDVVVTEENYYGKKFADVDHFVAHRIPEVGPAPDLSTLTYGEPVDLLANGLSDWMPMGTNAPNCWSFSKGTLTNTIKKNEKGETIHGVNLRTRRSDFENFRLTTDFRVFPGSNSGIYLKGIYEVQVLDSFGWVNDYHNCGALYGRVVPRWTVEKKAGEWQHYDITLVDRHVTVIFNGVKIIDNAPIRGVTGGAMTSDEFNPGPIYLQGDHSSAEYRNMVLTPVLGR